MKVPFADLRAQHDAIREDLDDVIDQVINQSSFVGGENVGSFEREFRDYCQTKHCIGCSSGTDALKLALMAAGVAPGDEVITVSHSFVATAEAIMLVGARPVFVDIDPKRYTMDPQKLREFLEETATIRNYKAVSMETGRRIGAILPVHLYGLSAEMKPILKLARRYNISVIEDACQAHGTIYRMEGSAYKAGSLGLCGAFSFYPGKNLGAMGEAGAVVTNSEKADQDIRVWCDHGRSHRYHHVSPYGWNGRLDAIQAAILRVKLKRLDGWNSMRRRVAGWYRERLDEVDEIMLPHEFEDAEHVYHLFVIRLKHRDAIRKKLMEQDIATGLHYPLPIHRQKGFEFLGYKKGSLPVTEQVAETELSLPMYPHLTQEQVQYVVEGIKRAVTTSCDNKRQYRTSVQAVP
jgi:dTDP-4-amino-4,6-dideoxygalactose transaminase